MMASSFVQAENTATAEKHASVKSRCCQPFWPFLFFCALLALPSLSSVVRAQDVNLAIPVLPPGKVTITFRTTIDNPLSAGAAEVCNQATVAGSEFASFLSDDPDDATSSADPTCLPVEAEPDMVMISKTADVASTAPGGTINYSLTYRNAGDQNATGVVLSETVPANTTSGVNVGWERTAPGSGLNCDSQAAGTQCFFSVGAVIGQGVNMTVGFQVVVDAVVAAGVTQIGNTGAVGNDGANGADPTANNAQTLQIPLAAAPDLEMVSKMADVATVMPGGTINYTLTYANNGDQDATGVVLSETVPAGTTSGTNAGWERTAAGSGLNCDSQPAATLCFLTIGALAVADGNQAASFQVVVDDPAVAGATQVSNTASVVDDGANGADPTANNSQTAVTPIDAMPDLVMVSKVADGATVAPGGALVYTLTYANTGDQDATGVVLSETVPAETTSGTNPGWERNSAGSGLDCDAEPAGTLCFLTLGALAAGSGNQTATFTVTVANPVAAGVATIDNTASVADDGANGADPTANNSQTVMTPLNAEPAFTLTKSYTGPTPFPGDTIAFDLAYANTGNQGATGVVLTETVPANTQFNAGASDAGWNCAAVTPGSVCTLDVNGGGELAGGGAAATVVFAVDLDDPLTAGVSQIDNCADMADDDTNGGTPTAQGCTTVNLDVVPPQVTVVDSVPGTGDGMVEECEVAQVAFAQLTLGFDEAMGQAPPANGVETAGNYRLFQASGPTLDIATTACNLIDPGDTEVAVLSATYDAGSDTVTLDLGAALANGQYRLFACATASVPGVADGLQDTAGNALDGTGDGNPGDDFVREFRVDGGNLFANGYFDCSLVDWTPTTPATYSMTDADGSPLSGSAQVVDQGAGISGAVSQCVDLVAGDQMIFASLRLDAAPGSFITFMVDCAFFSLPACDVGSQLDALTKSFLLQDTGGGFIPLQTDFTSPPSTRSALCTIGFDPAATGVDGFVDSLVLPGTPVIFADGFETGDTSAWSVVVP